MFYLARFSFPFHWADVVRRPLKAGLTGCGQAAWWRRWLHRLSMHEWGILAFFTDIAGQGV